MTNKIRKLTDNFMEAHSAEYEELKLMQEAALKGERVQEFNKRNRAFREAMYYAGCYPKDILEYVKE